MTDSGEASGFIKPDDRSPLAEILSPATPETLDKAAGECCGGSSRGVAAGEDAPIPSEPTMDLLETAWGIIANAGWDDCGKSPGWQEAAVAWRERYHAVLDAYCGRPHVAAASLYEPASEPGHSGDTTRQDDRMVTVSREALHAVLGADWTSPHMHDALLAIRSALAAGES